ncbi:MAG: hypothetical protein GF381_04725 [Candidatus Pacebacteria bacterium]|nr:hypothetical protein [Candidatus Paceibacterota bacterium]
MREHPIPQDITSYKFHLVGNMTLKQFAELIVGAIAGLLFYQTNLPTPIKWVFIIGSVGLGFAVAFVPIEERPLDHWIITFFKKMYSPTKFYWKKEPKIPSLFTYTRSHNQSKPDPEIKLAPIRRQKVQEFLQSINYTNSNQDEWEVANQQQVNSILQAFDQVQVDQESIEQKPQPQKPSLKTRVRSMKSRQDLGGEAAKNAPIPSPNPEPKPLSQPTDQQVDQGSQPARPTQAATNSQLPFPSSPASPNILVGMVLGPNNELVNDALIEIKNSDNQIIRAVKSNSLGQFSISSPLASDSYQLEIDQPNFQFQPLEITLSGEVVPPLEVRATQAQD